MTGAIPQQSQGVGYGARPGTMLGGTLGVPPPGPPRSPAFAGPGIAPKSPQSLNGAGAGIAPGFVPPTIQPGGIAYGKPAVANTKAPGLTFAALGADQPKQAGQSPGKVTQPGGYA